MKKLVYNLFLVFAILFSVVSKAQVPMPGADDIVKGKLRLKLKNEYLQDVNTLSNLGKKGATVSGIERLDDLNSKNNISRMKRVFPFSLKDEAKHREYGLHLWYEIDFDVNTDPYRLAEEYSLLAEVEIAKPLYKKVFVDGFQQDSVVVYLDTIRTKGNKITYGKRSDVFSVNDTHNDFDDPLLPQQWHYENDGTVGDEGIDIDLFNAWTKTTGNSKVIVSVVDGGIDVNHEDIKDNLWINEAELNGEPGVDDDGNGYVDDVNGYNFVYNGSLTSHEHGTHVAGTISAVNNNGIGVAGVAGGDGTGNGVRLMSCQIYDNRGGSGNTAAAIVYGADNGAIISQNSWGYTQPGFYEPEVYDAIKYFIAEAGRYEGSPMKGGVVICAAGNTGKNEEHYPGAFPEVIAVGASGPTGYPAPYSTHGDWVDLTAPGGDQAYYGVEGGVLSTLPSNEYGFLQGTSMACPHASGVAALIASRFGGDKFTSSEIRKILISSTTPFIYDSEGVMGSGDLNAATALIENEFKAPDAITDLSANEVFHNEVRLQWTVPKDDDDFQPSTFYFVFSEEEITATNFNAHQIYTIPSNYEVGTIVNINISGLIKNTDYWFAVKSGDRHQNISDISNILKVTTTDSPNFEESLREVEFTIDISNPVRRVPMDFSNTGEGIVYWIASNVNEKEWWIDTETWESDKDELLGTDSSAEDNSILGKKLAETEPIKTLSAEVLEGKDNDDYWLKNDITYFKDVYTYAYSYPTGAAASKSKNFGLTYAARFMANRGEFNMTHISLGLYSLTNEPIYIELRKGGKSIKDSEIFYVQKYIPEEKDGLVNAIVPLDVPQHFDYDEEFWVVLYFSRNEPYPLLVHKSGYYADTFYMSTDNGQTFVEAWRNIGNQVPFISLLSTGKDAPYVFLDPMSGEIHKGETQNVEMTIDASKLSNGKHLATLGVRTTDINKPGIGVKVKVTVTGQEAKIKLKDNYSFDIQTGKDNELEIKVKNIGLDSLFVTDIVRKDNGESLKNFEEDTLSIKVNGSSIIPFIYHTDVAGLESPNLLLKTNIGDVNVSTQMNAVAPAVINASLDKTTVDVQYGDTEKLKLTIKNEGTGSLLNYSLEEYNPAHLSNGLNPSKLGYRVRTSSDLVDPVTDTVVDISSVADIHYDERLPQFLIEVENENGFPMYDYNLGKMNLLNTGNFFGTQVGLFDFEEEVAGRGRASAYIGTLVLNLKATIYYLDFKSLGDRYIYTMKMRLARATPTGVDHYGNISYQVVLHRDGTIVIHYIDIDELLKVPNLDYAIGIQGMTPGDYTMYRKYGETDKNIHSGMTVKFEPIGDPTFISVDESRKGSIAKGETRELVLTVDPKYASIAGGTYSNVIKLESDATVETISIPVTVNILGTPDFEVPEKLTLPETHVGFSNTKYLTIENKGGLKGDITSVAFSNSDYSISNTTPIQLSAKSKLLLPVTYSPTNLSNSQATMTISFSNGSSETVLLTADVINNPVYTISLGKSIEKDVKAGEFVKVPFTINTSNSGSNLTYKFTNNLFAKVVNGKGQGVNPDTTKMFGYSRNLSGADKALHKWKDVKKEGQPHRIDFEKQLAMKLPFEFPFYGEKYDSIWVSKNGYVSVIKPTSDTFYGEFKKDDGIKGIIAPFMADLIPAEKSSKVWTLVEDDRVYIYWDHYRGGDVTSSGGSISFQLEIVNDGRVFFHYDDINKYTHMLNYGLESPDERETFEDYRSWILNWGVLTDSMTMAITPPTHGKLLSAEEGKFDLLLSAENIYKPGIYNDTLILSTNDNTQPELAIPVKLKVTGTANLELVDSLNYGEVIFASNKRIIKTFTLTNTGYEPLEIKKIKDANLYQSKIYNSKDEEIKRTSNGTLFSAIKIEPWTTVKLQSEIGIEQLSDVDGNYTFSGNFADLVVDVDVNVIESPVFVWDATDQNYNINNTERPEYSFTIRNDGPTKMKYEVYPAVVPVIGDGETQNPIVEELGEYFYEQPTTVDSLSLESKDKADGYEAPLIPTKLSFSNAYVAPSGGFYLTHIKVDIHLRKLGEYIGIEVYKGGDKPQAGELVYQQKFPTYKFVTDEWIYFPLEFPLSFAEGEKFYIVISPPPASKYVGYDIATSEDELENTWVANWQGWNGVWNWMQIKNMMRKYKIRALTAAGDGLWVELDNTNGVIEKGESKVIKATVDPTLSGGGEHKAFIKVSTTDVNHSRDEIKIELNVDNAPIIKFRPNMYDKKVKVTETEEITVNYLFEDVEDQGMKFTVKASNDTVNLKPIVKQTSNNTASITFKPGYFDAGLLKYQTSITDEAGNVVTDEILLEVQDKNRPPVMNPDFEVVTLNMADLDGGTLTIDPNELFSDADGDDLRILAGNYTPEIVDLALGQNYMDLHALQTGTGFVVFGADDGKENGFVVYGVYVIVIDDESTSDSNPDGYNQEAEMLVNGGAKFAVYPNPITSNSANAIFKLEKSGDVTIDVLSVDGTLLKTINKGHQEEGIFSEPMDVSGVSEGVYILNLQLDGQLVETVKVLVK